MDDYTHPLGRCTHISGRLYVYHVDLRDLTYGSRAAYATLQTSTRCFADLPLMTRVRNVWRSLPHYAVASVAALDVALTQFMLVWLC